MESKTITLRNYKDNLPTEEYNIDKSFNKCCKDKIQLYINNAFIFEEKYILFNSKCHVCGGQIKLKVDKSNNNHYIANFYNK